MNVAAVVVARGGSVRLPRKALLAFAGSTLIGHKVRTLCRTARVGTVYVNTDDAEIRAAAVAEGAVPLVGADYANDTRRMIWDSVRQVPETADVVVWAHPTNPLVRPETYDAAVGTFATAVGFDSLVSVTAVRRHAWVDGRPFNYDPWAPRHALAADLPPIHFQDGAIFVQTRARWVETAYFFGDAPYLFDVSAAEGVDVDLAEDYRLALALSNA
jgi:CMP-N,N'-diacetyllegionaminic acid synthase